VWQKISIAVHRSFKLQNILWQSSALHIELAHLVFFVVHFYFCHTKHFLRSCFRSIKTSTFRNRV
jgi:hypothetical protein